MFRTRQYAVFFILIGILAVLFCRLFYLQVLNYGRFSALADEQHNQVIKLEPRRGTIYDRFYEPLAINLDVPSVYIDPRFIHDKPNTASVLADKLGLDKEQILQRMETSKAFAWIKRKISVEKAQEIKSLKLPGVFFMTESQRNYPNDCMACHMLGFAGIDNNGLEGLELVLNDKLKGEPGFRHIVRDARAKPVLDNIPESIAPRNGENVVLTIDGVVQYILEEELKAMVTKWKASGATGIVMDPNTGQILALANYPGYDLNRFKDVQRDSKKDDAVAAVYEPGSVFKIVTASAVLNEGLFDLDSKFFCENGNYAVAGRVLHDYHPYGWLTFKEVIAKSSNVGTVKSAQRLGAKKIYEYIKRFGFGEKTGVDLPGEIPGISRPPSVWSKSDITTIPIGQGIAVTPIQLACAISAIANGGNLVKPYVIDKIVSWEGELIFENKPSVRRNVLKKETCEKVKEMLREVCISGTGKRANSDTYTTCGKTGTAQMVSPAGGYFANKYNSSFVGFAPMDKPVISVVIIANDPQPVHFGGTVAGPAFKNIVEKVLQYEASNKRVERSPHDNEKQPGSIAVQVPKGIKSIIIKPSADDTSGAQASAGDEAEGPETPAVKTPAKPSADKTGAVKAVKKQTAAESKTVKKDKKTKSPDKKRPAKKNLKTGANGR
jgi:cell division protein FtsI (penicillin-binding protein 3)